MADKRAALRFPTDLEASCQTIDATWASRLCNISTTGCMITLPDGGLRNNAPLRLRIRGVMAIDAEVVWQHRRHAGVRFRAPLHPAAIEHLGFTLPAREWESAFRSTQERANDGPERAVVAPSAPSLGGHLVKRSHDTSELHG
jgi:hypothetical protein